MNKNITSTATNREELKQELVKLSTSNPEKFYTFYAGFGKVTIIEHDKKPSSAYGEDCYRAFGGFFKGGKVVKPSSNWTRQYYRIPCGDR